jgi:hypothetical protein
MVREACAILFVGLVGCGQPKVGNLCKETGAAILGSESCPDVAQPYYTLGYCEGMRTLKDEDGCLKEYDDLLQCALNTGYAWECFVDEGDRTPSSISLIPEDDLCADELLAEQACSGSEVASGDDEVPPSITTLCWDVGEQINSSDTCPDDGAEYYAYEYCEYSRTVYDQAGCLSEYDAYLQCHLDAGHEWTCVETSAGNWVPGVDSGADDQCASAVAALNACGG